MTFLQPLLLAALPLAALPVIIHLVHLYRRRRIPWAAMMFLQTAQRMDKGISRLRRVLILAARVAAVAALILGVCRPLAGGWLGITGGAPETTLVLLDRSASMEQSDPTTGTSKRETGLRNIAKAIRDGAGGQTRVVLIDSARKRSQDLSTPEALLEVADTAATDTAGDLPGLLQSALDYVSTNRSGRTDIWLLSDLQETDWDASGGRWEAIREGFATLRGVRFHLLCYADSPQEDLGISVENVSRREVGERAEVLMDLRIVRQSASVEPVEVPVRFVVNGTATVEKLLIKEREAVFQAHALPIDRAIKRGWGRVEVPGDGSPANNTFHFVFDEAAPLQSLIVSDDADQIAPVKAVLAAPSDPVRKFAATIVPASRAGEIAWDDAAMIVWQTAIPAESDPLAAHLRAFAETGRALVFLPPAPLETGVESAGFAGLSWGVWRPEATEMEKPEWWRADAGLLAHARDGSPLPVGEWEVRRMREIAGESIPLARMPTRLPILARSGQMANVHFLGTLPGADYSSLGRDGIVLFASLHRALMEGASNVGNARQQFAGAESLGKISAPWQPMDSAAAAQRPADDLPLLAGVLQSGVRLTALNRPPSEDQTRRLSRAAVDPLFAGLDFRVLEGSLGDGRSLTNEVWRTFLIIMAASLLAEALLCMPSKPSAAIPNPGRLGSRPADLAPPIHS